MLLKIGDFSKLSQTTIRMLRHYDDIGLLKPAYIDKFTNYRYYSIEQLARIHCIIALKELGLSLEQIGIMLNTEPTKEQIQGMLVLQEAQIEARIREEQMRLAQVRFRLRMLDMEENMPQLDIVVKAVPEQHALSIRLTLQNQQMVAFGMEIENTLKQHKIELTGPLMEIRYDQSFPKKYHHDVEYVYPVADDHKSPLELPTFGIMQPKIIPALHTVATYVQKGIDLSTLRERLTVLQRWIVDNGYQLCDSNRIVFHNGPWEHAEYEDWMIEFQQEIAPASE